MAELHPAQRSGLDLVPSERPALLLTRHSVRELGNGVPSYDLPLTPEGVALAEQWGRELPRPLHSLHSSPVGRCMDTARAIARGAGVDLEIRQTYTLVEPGCFVQNIARVGPLFLELGALAFANHHFSESVEGLLSPEEGSARLIRHLHEHQGAPGTLSVHVTHDTILAAFIYHLMGRDRIDEH
ncbi:MAG: histidine phosphatase family protein, partial [Moraxellaceae bacterium]|nr:histidine phosphatase family protein [Moraxellaceae bacterium]